MAKGGDEMPDRLCIDGRWYVAEEAIAAQGAAEPEPYLMLNALCKKHHVDPHRANDAARAGALDAPMPNGQTRGRRCREGEFLRWMERDLMRRGR